MHSIFVVCVDWVLFIIDFLLENAMISECPAGAEDKLRIENCQSISKRGWERLASQSLFMSFCSVVCFKQENRLF